jgi:hypothetical protein
LVFAFESLDAGFFGLLVSVDDGFCGFSAAASERRCLLLPKKGFGFGSAEKKERLFFAGWLLRSVLFRQTKEIHQAESLHQQQGGASPNCDC